MLRKALLLTILVSCSHLSSGVYVVLKEGDTVSTLAKEFKTQENYILDFNNSARFVPGELIFIPFNAGILGQIDESKNYRELLARDYIWPVPGYYRVSSKYGGRWGGKHNGIDIPAKKGSDILAAANGVVVYSGNGFTGFGNIIIVAHQHGFFTLYAHNDTNLVRNGEKVLKGDKIAIVGNSGKSTGPHLHFEIRKYNTPLDPMTLISNSKKY